MKVNTRATLTAMVYPVDADDQRVVWASSDPSVAAVDENGTVTAMQAGTAQITAQVGGITATCTVAVDKDIFSGALGVPGDVTVDGKVNLADVSLILKYIAKWDVTLITDIADVTDDGKVNLADISLLLKYIAKWDVVLK